MPPSIATRGAGTRGWGFSGSVAPTGQCTAGVFKRPTWAEKVCILRFGGARVDILLPSSACTHACHGGVTGPCEAPVGVLCLGWGSLAVSCALLFWRRGSLPGEVSPVPLWGQDTLAAEEPSPAGSPGQAGSSRSLGLARECGRHRPGRGSWLCCLLLSLCFPAPRHPGPGAGRLQGPRELTTGQWSPSKKADDPSMGAREFPGWGRLRSGQC